MMLCGFCGKDIIKKLPRHIQIYHPTKTLRDNTILINHLDENNLPKCVICQRNDVMIDRIVHKTCSNPACIEALKAQNRHEGQVIENRRRVEEGTSNLLRKNLIYDEQGKSIIHTNSYRSRMINGNLRPMISQLEKRVSDYIKTRYPRTTTQYGIPESPGNHPYDIYVPDLKLLIEVDGEYWHDPIEDKRWDDLAHQYGYQIERISWNENHDATDEELSSKLDTILDRYPVVNQWFPAAEPLSIVKEEL